MADEAGKQKQRALKGQLERVQEGYGEYAQRLHDGSYTTWAETGAAERNDLTDLGLPKGPVGNILKAAKSGYIPSVSPQHLATCLLACKTFINISRLLQPRLCCVLRTQSSHVCPLLAFSHAILSCIVQAFLRFACQSTKLEPRDVS